MAKGRAPHKRKQQFWLAICAIDALESRLLLTSGGATLSDLTVFRPSTDSSSVYPSSGVTLDGNTLYGTNWTGGADFDGDVYSVPVTGGTPTVLASFNGSDGSNPTVGVVVSDSGSTLYGTTSGGGANNTGVVFSLPITGGLPTVLASFSATNNVSGVSELTIYGSALYGVANGTIFSEPITGGALTVLATNTGAANFPLTIANDTIYAVVPNGGAYNNGAVFSLPITGGTPNVEATFDSAQSGSGYIPDCSLVLSSGWLYGTTDDGGASSDGSVFTVPIGGGPIYLLGSFNGTDGANPVTELLISGSTLYGTTQGGSAIIFSEPITGGTPTAVAQFSSQAPAFSPLSNQLALSQDGSTLYGVTELGQTFDEGGVFSLAVTGGTPTTLAAFNDLGDGDLPQGGLALSGDTLYGITYASAVCKGGVYYPTIGYGEVFSQSTTGGLPTVLATFDGQDGQYPVGGLIVSGNTIYGTTELGGTFNDGVVFSLPITGGTATVLASFNGADGSYPVATLLVYGTTLYGTTGAGGVFGDGVIFSLPITGGTPNVLANFNGANGIDPSTSLILSNGNLFGMAQSGGADSDGTVFMVPATGGTVTDLASFNGTNGSDPAGLIVLKNGMYGSTTYGGANGSGELFALPITGGTVNVIYSFPAVFEYPTNVVPGPVGNLLMDGNGNLFGATEGETESRPLTEGSVFQFNVTTRTFVQVVSFNQPGPGVGILPDSGLTADAAGNLYGTTYYNGTIFEVSGSGFSTMDAWTGAVSNNFNDPANWSTGAVPGASSDAVINGGDLVAAGAIDVGSITLNGATLQLAPNTGMSYVATLTITNGGTLDVTNNSLMINYGTAPDPKAAILSYLSSGSNGGRWNGTGIISSTALSNPNYGVGYSDGADGVDPNLTNGEIEVAYAQCGDITMQGQVNAADFHILATDFGTVVTNGWESGDFMYLGIVNGQDFSLLGENFGQTAVGEADETVPVYSSTNVISISAVSSTPSRAAAPKAPVAAVGVADTTINFANPIDATNQVSPVLAGQNTVANSDDIIPGHRVKKTLRL